MPALQYEHTAQVRPSQGTPRRTPILKRAAFLPFAATRPTISWPGTKGSLGFVNSPSITCRSVLQSAHALTWMRTSPSAGAGSGTSVSSSELFVLNNTIARMCSSRGTKALTEGRDYGGIFPSSARRGMRSAQLGLGTYERIAMFLGAIYGNNARGHHVGIRAKQVGNQLGEDVICVAAGRLSNSSSNAASGD